MRSLKTVFNTLWYYFYDIRLYLIGYNVISTYFRRISRTGIVIRIADHILLHIYKHYFIPRLFSKSGYIKDTPLDFKDDFLINKFKNKIKIQNLEDQLNYIEDKSINIELEIDKIIEALMFRLYENNLDLLKTNIKYIDFVEEICYYSVLNKKLKKIIKTKYDLELKISKFKVQLGEWIVSAFEENDVISSNWRDGCKDISILNLTTKKKELLNKYSSIKFTNDL